VTPARAGAAAFAETPGLPDLARHEAAWRELAARAAEPNAFAEAAFLLPALARLAPRSVATLLVWSDAARARLIGVAAIERAPLTLGLARVWRSEQAALAALLVDREATEEALVAILAWTAAHGAAGLRLPCLEAQGPIARAVAALAARRSLPVAALDERQRAALPVGPAADFEASVDKKRRKEWARQRRRLADRGRLETRLLDAEAGAEAFLTLEKRGWKGVRGTALAQSEARAAFTRDMLARFSAQGALRAAALTLDDAPIAVGLVLRSGARGFYWKTAYDERFAEYSPGLLLTLDLSHRLEREDGLTLVDSCAAPNHPMIDRLWRGRLDLVDLALAVRPEAARRFALALGAARLRERARERLKQVVNRVLRRKSS
jgi:CelD/BcsL family acetyltransferase involved in cellulose biosynthesis